MKIKLKYNILKTMIIWAFTCLNGYIFAQNFKVGDLYTTNECEQGIVFHVFPDGSGALIVALNDLDGTYQWGVSSNIMAEWMNVDDAIMMDMNGYENTRIIRNNSNANSAANNLNFENGWYLPTIDELSKLYGSLCTIDELFAVYGGSTLSEEQSYWSSTQQQANRAWTVGKNGKVEYKSKVSGLAVRPIKRVQCMQEGYDTAFVYKWKIKGSEQEIDSGRVINVLPRVTTDYIVTVENRRKCVEEDTITIFVEGVPIVETASVCYSPYIWHNHEYASSGIYTSTRESANCAQVKDTLYLTINPSYIIEVADTVCSNELPYSWRGRELIEAGTFYDSLTTLQGCDSVYKLVLSISSDYLLISNETVCEDAVPYLWRGRELTTTGTYYDTLTTAHGCDSLVAISLTVASLPVVNIQTSSDTICVGDSVVLNTVVANAASLLAEPVVPTIAIGDILCTDGSIVKPNTWPMAGKEAMGIVFYVDQSGEHGWAMHLQESDSLWWITRHIPELSMLTAYPSGNVAIIDMDGYGNTQAIRAIGSASDLPAAYAVDFGNGWYLPALGQLNLMFSEALLLNNSLQAVNGTLFMSNLPKKYWSSTIRGVDIRADIWVLWETGIMFSLMGDAAGGLQVRAVRNF